MDQGQPQLQLNFQFTCFNPSQFGKPISRWAGMFIGLASLNSAQMMNRLAIYFTLYLRILGKSKEKHGRYRAVTNAVPQIAEPSRLNCYTRHLFRGSHFPFSSCCTTSYVQIQRFLLMLYQRQRSVNLPKRYQTKNKITTFITYQYIGVTKV